MGRWGEGLAGRVTSFAEIKLGDEMQTSKTSHIRVFITIVGLVIISDNFPELKH